jgi:predicted ATP-grasp superfamily ATP-dependent carboligase
LRDPILVAAFGGWGDASSVATTSATFLLQKREVTTVAEFDPEEYFVLSETRPHVRLKDGGQRRIQWPSLALVAGQREPRDFVALLGPEPQLRWRSFARQVAQFWREHGQGGPAVVLGAFLAGVSHAAPTVLTGFATTPEYRERLSGMGIQPSGYEGPTGIHSALMEAFEAEGIAAASIWAAAPHYLGAMPNPKTCADQLAAVERFFELGLDLSEMREAGATFEKQVGMALAKTGQNLNIVQNIEALQAERPREERSPEPLPSAEELVQGVEEFLRQNRAE